MKAAAQILNDGSSILFGGDFERYQRRTGPWDKGDPKIYNKLIKTLPFTQLVRPAKQKMTWFHMNN